MGIDRQEVGHHLHHNYIGHDVTVRTPGALALAGLLVAVGVDRLIISAPGCLTTTDRLLTTHLEVEYGGQS